MTSNQAFLQSTSQSINWFKKSDEQGELEMRPPFQRNPVWTDAQRSYLIDTILNGYPIPEIYLQTKILDDASEQHVIVDGQQRITACLKFVRGEFPISQKEQSEFAGFYFEDLPLSQQKAVYSYKFVVRDLPDIPDPTLREIFRRLNKNVVSLNSQELRHATYSGDFIKMAEDVANDNFWRDMRIFSANDYRRMKDAEYVSELAVALMNGHQNKKISLDTWYQAYEEDFDRNDCELTFKVILQEIGRILPDLGKTRWRNKADFYSLFMVFSEIIQELSLAKDERAATGSSLTEFSDEVMRFVRTNRVPSLEIDLEEGTVQPVEEDEDEINVSLQAFAPSVVQYAAHVQKASSDLGSRKKRHTALLRYLADNAGGVWNEVL